jgi:uncharacterized protein YdeI (YjbR/CyaY-like superfamily)
MPITQTVYAATRAEWRAWLEANHASQAEIWLIFYKQGSGKPRLPYDDAVEEALCFGWIDSLVQRIDDQRYAQKFSPRRENSKWSPSNKTRVKKLIAEGRMTAAGLAKIPAWVLDEPDDLPPLPPPPPVPLDPPEWVAAGLQAHPPAWDNFQNMTPGARRQYIRWLMEVKSQAARQRRLEQAAAKLIRNEKLGMV